MYQQLNIFEFIYPKYKIDKPIRLIELFAGIGAQAKALENLKADFTHYKICEFDKYAVTSYNAIHNTNFKTSDITKLKAEDLEIVDTDKYCYIMTYSFPCQDLSLAGKRRGMSKTTQTRSGLLWEVERLLTELRERESKSLPQILLMENVPQVIGSKNIKDFTSWYNFLSSLGYKSYYEILNSKDYGIPQNRKRCFMISLLDDYSYTFPKKKKLNLFLSDLLEKDVDESYFLTKKQELGIFNSSYNSKRNSIQSGNISQTICAHEAIDPKCVMVKINENNKQGYKEASLGDAINISGRMKHQRGNVQRGISQTLTTQINVGTLEISKAYSEYLVEKNLIKPYEMFSTSFAKSRLKGKEKVRIDGKNCSTTITTRIDSIGCGVKEGDLIRIRKLTPKECFRLMGFSDIDYENASKVNSKHQLYKQAGNSIVVNVLMEIFKELL